MPERPSERPAHGVGLAAWLAWLTALVAGLSAGPSPLGPRLLGLGLAAGLLWGSALLAGRWARSLRSYRVRIGTARATSPRFEPGRIEAWVRLALHGSRFFEAHFTAYLGSLALGRPLGPLGMWASESDTAQEARQAFAEAAREAPAMAAVPEASPGASSSARPVASDRKRPGWLGPWARRRPPSPAELEDLIERMETAYEHRRRSPGL